MRWDVVVVGAGHAGIEAALAAARMGRQVACVTLRRDRIGHLPCNCSIGGPAKGHMAREVDALGGEMGVCTDHALTHMRRVGTGKGPAVQTLRAHVCKDLYPRRMEQTLAQTRGLTVFEAMVQTVVSSDQGVQAVCLEDGTLLEARAVVLTTGTFLNGLCHEGRKKTVAARFGDRTTVSLSDYLVRNGIRLRRFKTGTTPRIRLTSIDFSKTIPMASEPDAGTFSFLHDRIQTTRPLLPAWQTTTTHETHHIVRLNLGESAMYSGQIQGVGPRYCPSIEDKVVRFAEKDSHPIFLEQETWDGDDVYVQGMSTSLPADVQLAMLRSVPGLGEVEMIRPGYAVEYDMADPLQLTGGLMSKLVPGLFLAGQLNGTSGYEEAAGQGIVAGINAAQYSTEQEPVLFPRSESFVGVMIDDLITKGVEDPYRMLTARAEHRLLLRHDNADQRLTPVARRIGLCDDRRWERFERKMAGVDECRAELEAQHVSPAHHDILHDLGIPPVANKTSFFDLLRRPEVRFGKLDSLAESVGLQHLTRFAADVREQVYLAAIYDGYIQIQERLANQTRDMDGLVIPTTVDFHALNGLSFESREKMDRVRPGTVGQASRIPGVRPADIALLVGHLRGVTRLSSARPA